MQGKSEKEIDFLRLTEEECRLLEHIGTPVRVESGHSVYMKGDTADRLYYIKKGRVRIYDNVPSGREITVDVIEAGHIFGESAFSGVSTRPVNVEAVTEATLIVIKMTVLAEQMKQHPTLALHLLQMLSDSMDRLMNRVEEQCLLDRYGKTASYLLDVTSVESEEKGTLGGIVPYTHGELADSLGLNRTTVTSVLKYFDQKKWISCGYGQIRVVEREKLREFVEEQKA